MVGFEALLVDVVSDEWLVNAASLGRTHGVESLLRICIDRINGTDLDTVGLRKVEWHHKIRTPQSLHRAAATPSGRSSRADSTTASSLSIPAVTRECFATPIPMCSASPPSSSRDEGPPSE